MTIRQWNPATASDQEINAWVALNNDCLSHDLPGDPLCVRDGAREWLSLDGPDYTRIHFIDDDFRGWASLRLYLGENAQMADINIHVSPRHRRQGIGTALVAAVVESARGRRSLTASSPEGSDGGDFARAIGFREVLREARSLLTLADVDWNTVREMAGRAHPGYELRTWEGPVPEEMQKQYAAAKLSMNDAPLGDLDMNPVHFDVDRGRKFDQLLAGRGVRIYRTVAVHVESGDVAGLTELNRIPTMPTRGDQGDTCVVPDHRGHGLGLWIKAATLLRFVAEEPGVVDIQTWNAASNEHMLAVNYTLGFHRDRIWCEYQAPIAELEKTLTVSS